MPDAGCVVAGHDDGRLSLWSAEDGTCERVINSGREVGRIVCIDISANGSFAVTARDRTVLVWETSTWNVRCALESHSKRIHCAATLPNTKRVVAFNGVTRFVWDAEKGGAALTVIKTGLKPSYFGEGRAFVNSDGRHLVWATNDSTEAESGWNATLIDAVQGRVIVEESIQSDEQHQECSTPCVWADSHPSQIGATASWKRATFSGRCLLPSLTEESDRCWQISSDGRKRVQCALLSAGGQLSDSASIELDSGVFSIDEQWLPDLG